MIQTDSKMMFPYDTLQDHHLKVIYHSISMGDDQLLTKWYL